MRMKTILVPVDLSKVSESVVDAAIALGRDTHANLVVFHVIRPPIAVSEFPQDYEEVTLIAERVAADALARYRGQVEAHGVEVTTRMAFGQPVACILEESERLQPQYLVMGSHRHTAIYELLLGSTTRGIVRESKFPVLLVNGSVAAGNINVTQPELAVHE